jgi:hypothetical protein
MGTSPRSRRFGDPEWLRSHPPASRCPGDKVVPKAQFGIEASTLSPKKRPVQAPGIINSYPSQVPRFPRTCGASRDIVVLAPFRALDLVAQLGVCCRREFDYYVQL